MADGYGWCDLCGGDSATPVADRDRKGRPWVTVCCDSCGLVRHGAMPTEAELADFYARQYRKAYHNESAPSARRVRRAWLKARRVQSALRPHLNGGERVFEAGAGIGCNLLAFARAGHPVEGVEPNVGFQEFARGRLGLNVAAASVFDWRPERPYDLILLIHVIEHFRSPSAAFRKLHGLLSPGGRLYLECPSLATPFSDASEQFHYAHTFTFTPATLLKMAERHGFTACEVYSGGWGQNHKILFERVRPDPNVDLGSGREETLEILTQFRRPWKRYSLDYVKRRARRAGIYLSEFLLAGRTARRLTQRPAA